MVGLIALLVLMGGAVAALIDATRRNEERSDARDKEAVVAAMEARTAHMASVLAGVVSGREAKVLDDVRARRLDELDAEIGEPLATRFGFEFVYVIDHAGNLLYASERGRQGETQGFQWIGPAIHRTLNDSERANLTGLVVASDAAGLMAARPLSVDAASSGAGGPLMVVTVDLMDESFLSEVFGATRLEGVHLARAEVGPTQKAVGFTNLADGAPVQVAWTSAEQPSGVLQRFLPVLAAAATVLCLVFFALFIRARRVAAALAVSEARARELAHKDSLTGLANRTRFVAELERALAASSEREPLALFFVDLDGFKEINDTLGHSVGDELLCVVARRLRGCVGDRGLVARFGGDEFVLFARYAEGAELSRLVTALFGVLDIPVTLQGKEFSVSASVGAARAPMDAGTSDELMSLADVALYRAKSEGRGTYRLFEARFERERMERRRTEVELAAALEKGELKLVFQPQVDVESERIVGFETLVRWDHPVRGHILPSEFVPVAEGSRLISRLDSYVLRTACEQARELPGVTISVNMSPLNMRHAGLVDDILVTLRQTGFDPHRLEIEITESAILDASPEGQEALGRLRELGVRLALDDFGTGHASLVHVRRFPITKIKIDKSFILNLGVQRDAASIVEYVVRLGRSLGITLTAEGVETREQLRFLRAFGAHQAQGYLFSPPLPLAGAAALLKRQQEADLKRSARAVQGDQQSGSEAPAK